jgi:hypothetical protein
MFAFWYKHCFLRKPKSLSGFVFGNLFSIKLYLSMRTLRSSSSVKKFGYIRGRLKGSVVLIVIYPWLFGQISYGCTDILL